VIGPALADQNPAVAFDDGGNDGGHALLAAAEKREDRISRSGHDFGIRSGKSGHVVFCGSSVLQGYKIVVSFQYSLAAFNFR
jgi:hypothetical protein